MPLVPGAAVRVRVPASSANLGPGFDSIGLALGIWDTYVAAITSEPGLRVEIEGDAQGVVTDERHLVAATMRRAWADLGVQRPTGLLLRCHSTIRHGRGMGSSAAAIVGGVTAAHALAALSRDPDVDPLVDLDAVNGLASTLEGHPDNASASVYGGLTLSWTEGSDDEPQVRSVGVPLHPDIEPVVIVPAVQLPTATARAVLPATVPHREAALNSGRAALLVLAVSTRPELLLPATCEWLHQQQRRSSFGGAMELVDDLRAAGHAAVISGAGPSVLVLSTTARADAVTAHVTARDGGRDGETWRVLRPGVPAPGVQVERVMLDMLPGGSDTHR